MADTQFITDRQIYEQVIQDAVPSAQAFLWLATSDLKDLHVQAGRQEQYAPQLRIRVRHH